MLLARIREQDCIGCTKCIQACPVDAIVGAMQLMHTVIKAECIGCKLCVAPCPTDCIEMIEFELDLSESEQAQRASLAKTRHKARRIRLQEKALSQKALLGSSLQADKETKQQDIQAALARIKAKNEQQKTDPTL